MSKKGENIFLRKDGRWEARYVKEYDENNKIIYGYAYGKTYSAVKKKRNDILLELSSKNNKKLKNYQDFDSLIDSWLLQKKISVKDSTYSIYLDIINKHLRPFFGKIKITNITDNLISKFIMLKIKEGLKEKTIKDISVLLKQILNYGKINVTIKTPKVKKKQVKILNQNEQRKLENYIKTSFDNIELGIILALYMGLRIGEVCALKWSDIDISNQVINVNHTISRVRNFDTKIKTKTIVKIDEPKTENSKRTIPIPKTILTFLELLKAKSTNENNYVLTNSDKFLEPRSYYNKYKKILKKLELAGFNFHSLRHTFATRCIELGFDPKTLSEILGHADIKITLAFYVHPTNHQKILSMDKLSFLSI